MSQATQMGILVTVDSKSHLMMETLSGYISQTRKLIYLVEIIPFYSQNTQSMPLMQFFLDFLDKIL